jgi:hypothetical protein
MVSVRRSPREAEFIMKAQNVKVMEGGRGWHTSSLQCLELCFTLFADDAGLGLIPSVRG